MSKKGSRGVCVCVMCLGLFVFTAKASFKEGPVFFGRGLWMLVLWSQCKPQGLPRTPWITCQCLSFYLVPEVLHRARLRNKPEMVEAGDSVDVGSVCREELP